MLTPSISWDVGPYKDWFQGAERDAIRIYSPGDSLLCTYMDTMMKCTITRRSFAGATLAASAAGFANPAVEIQHRGVLIRECGVPGETRADDVTPAHPNGIPLSADRWLLVYATRGFRGVDDDLSIMYQLRRGSVDGAVIREGALARTSNDWDPYQEGKGYVKQHGHPVAFGVPKGATVDGKPLPHANHFVAKWRRVARVFDKSRNYVEHATSNQAFRERTMGVQCVQFRLNDREDDIEIVQAPAALRQKGYESGPSFCSAKGIEWMNQSFVEAIPFNRDATEWVDFNHFSNASLAAIKYRFNPARKLYEWVETGPFFAQPGKRLIEGGIARVGRGWVLSARVHDGVGVAWGRTEDPFHHVPAPVLTAAPRANAPLTVYTCADGVLRILTGDSSVSPHKASRDPLYLWDVDPDNGFAVTNRRVVFDTVKAGLPIRKASSPKVDMAKILVAQRGEQFIVHRVSIRSFNHPYVGAKNVLSDIPLANREEKEACAIYYAKLNFGSAAPSFWTYSAPAKTR